MTENSSATPRPRREKANLHPGRLVLDTQTKWRTPAEKHAADLRAKEIQAARNAAIQQGCAWVSEMEETMEVEQAEQATAKVKPVRPKWGPGEGRPTNISGLPCGPPCVDREDQIS